MSRYPFFVLLLLLLVAAPVYGGVVFTVEFGPLILPPPDLTYAGDSFSFVLPDFPVLTVGGPGQVVSVPGGELNGYTFDSVLLRMVNNFGLYLDIQSIEEPIDPQFGDVTAFWLRVPVPSATLDFGTYNASWAERCVEGKPTPCVSYSDGGTPVTGSLSMVPEPATWLMAAGALGTLVLVRRRRR